MLKDSIQSAPKIVEKTELSQQESASNEHESSGSERSDEDDCTMFEKRVSFEISDGNDSEFRTVGMGILRIAYDDEVFGYHVYMTSDNGQTLCEHIIAIQTALRTEKKQASWSAIDLTLDAPRRRRFRATFSSIDALKEFSSVFEEGTEAAVHSEIVEKTDCFNSDQCQNERNDVYAEHTENRYSAIGNASELYFSQQHMIDEPKISCEFCNEQFTASEIVQHMKSESGSLCHKPNSKILVSEIDLLSKHLKDLFTNENCWDTVVEVDNKEFKVHRAILSARSSVFSAMFQHETTEKQTGIIKVPDCDVDSFKLLLEYLYTGKLENISSDSVIHLYTVSDKYNVQELKTSCTNYLTQNITVQNVSEVVILADQYDEENLFSVIQKFFNKNFNEIVQTKEWENLLKCNYRLANKLLIGKAKAEQV